MVQEMNEEQMRKELERMKTKINEIIEYLDDKKIIRYGAN